MTAAAPAGVLLPYQAKWIADESDVKVAEKSRRVGLSWAEAADDTLYAASVAGDDVFYIGYNAEMARGFINDCAFWAKHYNLAAAAMDEPHRGPESERRAGAFDGGRVAAEHHHAPADGRPQAPVEVGEEGEPRGFAQE